MSEKYIRKNRNSYVIVKNSKNYGKFQNKDDAIFARDLLVENNWNLDSINELYHVGDKFIVVKVIDEKMHVLARLESKPTQNAIDKMVKRQIRNPNNSKYGLNITKVFDTYVIKKQIAGDDYIFGYYDNLADAEFVRNYLLDHMWNVAEFSQIQYDEDTDTFKVCEIIDDKVYVLATFDDETEIDLDDLHKKFLSKISKHKYGLASHPDLDELTDKIPELEEMFDVKAEDENWAFDNVESPLDDIIFKLTPFQKSVYDAIGEKATFDDVKKALIRYKSGNFDEKILKNLDELIELGLISKNQDYYVLGDVEDS